MFFDARTNPEVPTDYDVVIVGAGPAGITVASELGRIECDPNAYNSHYFGGTSILRGGQCTTLEEIDPARASAPIVGTWVS